MLRPCTPFSHYLSLSWAYESSIGRNDDDTKSIGRAENDSTAFLDVAGKLQIAHWLTGRVGNDLYTLQ